MIKIQNKTWKTFR